MLEPVSIIESFCPSANYAALNGYARTGSAVSIEAQQARKAATAVIESIEQSQALFGEKSAAISQLMRLANECAEPDWDGNESCALNPSAVLTAEDFIRAMPNDMLLPEFAPEPDGSVSLDWIQSRHRLFSLSIGGSNRLAYAWLDGADKGHAVAQFDGCSIPPRVLDGIRSVINHANASLRAA
jgi:hypothetical protein